ncbi:MAG: hypothetical protein AB7N90_17350 [Vicinamibacterales bacterium]
MNGWLKQNLFQLLMAGAMVILLAGQWQERQAHDADRLTAIEARVADLERYHTSERARLDTVYMPRELSLSQNVEILRRLDVIEKKLDGRRSP